MIHGIQALQKYRDTAIDESERIEEEFDVLIKAFDLDSSFIFHVGLDVQPTHSWKAPYRDLKARHVLLIMVKQTTYIRHDLLSSMRQHRLESIVYAPADTSYEHTAAAGTLRPPCTL